MPSKISNWVKTHKFHTFVIVVVILYILFKVFLGSRAYRNTNLVGEKNYPPSSYNYSYDSGGIYDADISGSQGNLLSFENRSSEDVSSEISQGNRKVITNSSFSLHVKNVDSAVENIREKTAEMGGFIVNTNIRRDEGASSAVVEIRIPSDQLVEFSEYLKTLAVKVVYENITGKDITDRYVDYEEKLRSLESVKARFEEIMEKAQTVDEIMNVQNRIMNVQSQIDSVKGQLDYMEKSVAMSKVIVNLSTDELSLPYTPVKSWRPEVIAKEAVRALISVFRGIGTVGIWLVIFLPLVLLILAVKVAVRYISRNRKKKKELVKDLK
jgi:hypothetical protein